MPIHKLKLIARQEIARDTVEFRFEKPEGFNFKPGQYGGFTLVNPHITDAGGITRRFSLLNAPHDNHLAFTTRIQSSAYKQVLKDLAIGSEIKFAGPTGNFVLHDDTTIPAVLIAGGIGITPFYSIIRDLVERHSDQKIILFYGNQSSADSAYLTELQKISKQHSTIQLVATMANDSAWQGETGFISYEMIKKYINNLNEPLYYVCGSPAMVSAMRELLSELEINDDRIKVEDFPGY